MEENRKKSLTREELALQLGCWYYYCAQYGYCRSVLTTKELHAHASKGNIHNCAPILRPMNDVTEEEALKVLDLGGKNPVAGNVFNARQFQYLLELHFDLFGWIEDALAIDATTLEDNPYGSGRGQGAGGSGSRQFRHPVSNL